MLNRQASIGAGLSAALALSVAMAADPRPKSPAPAAGAPIHHQGLKGQASPHNGWARYGRLTLDVGGDRYHIYDQTAAEFSATVIDRESGAIKIRGVNIPGAGFFYYPSEASPCQPDALERMGLYAELLLFYLSSAFPAGPGSVDAASSGVVDSPIPELHFMQGIMKPREGARTLVTVTPVSASKLEYVLHDDRENIQGTWEAGQTRAVIPDDEALLDWHSCWAGGWSTRTDGVPFFSPRIQNARSLKTFGDVRKALRQAQRSRKK